MAGRNTLGEAAPSPHTNRAASSVGMLWARPAPTAAVPYRVSPTRIGTRRPHRSDTVPHTICPAAMPRR